MSAILMGSLLLSIGACLVAAFSCGRSYERLRQTREAIRQSEDGLHGMIDEMKRRADAHEARLNELRRIELDRSRWN